jgi:hypothetical protein
VSDPVLTALPVATTAEFAARLAALQQALPAGDGLAYFNHMYALVTSAVSQNLNASAFADPTWLATLDVVFGNLYLDAVRNSVEAPDQVPRAWAALFERRSDTRVAPLQLALAGMNAHINRDLPLAITQTCTQLGTAPDAGSHHADFERVNAVLAGVEPAIRQSVEDAFLSDADRLFPGLQDVVANFDMVKARETAWGQAIGLWRIQQVAPGEIAVVVEALDHLTGLAGRGLLVPLRS